MYKGRRGRNKKEERMKEFEIRVDNGKNERI